MSLFDQFELVTYTIIYGLFLGITYDCVSLLKRPNWHLMLDGLINTCFWMCHIPVIIIYLSNVNDGQFHMYIFFFFLIGLIGYYKILKTKFRQDLEKLGECIFLIINFINKILNLLVISPILFIYRIIFDIIKVVLRFFSVTIFGGCVKFTRRIFKQRRIEKRRIKQKKDDNS